MWSFFWWEVRPVDVGFCAMAVGKGGCCIGDLVGKILGGLEGLMATFILAELGESSSWISKSTGLDPEQITSIR